jgi:hypothetical protein
LLCQFQIKVGADFLIFKDVDDPAQHNAKGRKSSFKNYEICISAMMTVALFHSLFSTENACLPVGREDRNARLWIVRQLYSCLFY